MKVFRSIPMGLSLGVLLLAVGSARATIGIANIWQLDYAETSCSLVLAAAADCSLCHTTIPAVNVYGQDIADNGFGWFGIEPLDSDGDGRTNGDEIRIDCSLPGDATSPTESTTWSRIRALYRN